MDGENLREASHERAVEVIRKAGNPVTFLVQSLIDWEPDPAIQSDASVATTAGATTTQEPPDVAEHPPASLLNGDSTPDGGFPPAPELPKVAPELISPVACVTPIPEVIQSGVTAPPPPAKPAPMRQETEPGESEEEDDDSDLQGRTILSNGAEVSHGGHTPQSMETGNVIRADFSLNRSTVRARVSRGYPRRRKRPRRKFRMNSAIR